MARTENHEALAAIQLAKRAVVQAGARVTDPLVGRAAVVGLANAIVRSAAVSVVAMVEDNIAVSLSVVAGSVLFPNRPCLVVCPLECETVEAWDVTDMTTCTVERILVLATSSDNTSMVIQHIA